MFTLSDVHFVGEEIHMVLKPYNDREAVPEEFKKRGE